MTRRNLGAEYGRTLARLDVAERRLRRAFNAWVRESARLRSLGKRIDALQTDLDNLNRGA